MRKSFLIALLALTTSAFAAISPADKATLGVSNNAIANGGCEQSTYGFKTYSETQAATFTNGSANIGITSTTGYVAGQQLTFSTTGTLPTNFTAGTLYYVASIVNGSTLTVSASIGGTAITAGSAGSGVHTLRPATPIAGTGGSPNVTFSATATAPIQDAASCLMTKDANNREGEGWSYAFTIPNGQQAKVQNVQFDYVVNSGTFAAGSSFSSYGDMVVWIYDVTNSTLIQPATFFTTCSSTSVYCTFTTTFQTAVNSTSYRLIWHVSSTSTSAWAVKSDSITVGPGPLISTVVPISSQAAELINVGFSATSSSNTLVLTLTQADGVTSPSPSNPVKIGFRNKVSPYGLYNERTITAPITLTLSQGTTFGLDHLLGVNANVWIYAIDSDGAGTIKLGASIIKYDEKALRTIQQESETVTITNATPAVFTASGNKLNNNDAIKLTTTGALPTGLSTATQYYVTNSGTDGTDKFRVSLAPGGTEINTSSAGSGVHTLHVVNYRLVSDGNYAGAPIRLIGRISENLSVAGNWPSPGDGNVASLATAALPETIAIRYHTTTAQIMTGGGVFTTIGYDIFDYDTHATTNAVATTAWFWIAPADGKYAVNAFSTATSTTFVANDYWEMRLKKGTGAGTTISDGPYMPVQASVTNNIGQGIYDEINLLQGDVLFVGVLNGHSTNVNLDGAAADNYISIHRIGSLND